MAKVKVSVEQHELERASGGGVIAGLAAGLFLTLMMLLTFSLKGQDLWLAFKGTSVPFFGKRAMVPGFDLAPVVVGAIAHYAISAGWGFLFGILAYGLSRPLTLLAGALWGIVVWLGMYYAVLPIVGLAAMARSVPVGTAVLNHVLFGLVLSAAFLPFQRRLPGRWPYFRRAASVP